MAKRRFKGAATSSAFKSIGASLQASRGELEKKTRRDVETLKLAKLQRAELDKISIGDLTDNARSEEYMLKEKQNLEQKARQTRYEAVVKHAATDVARLEGEAKEAEKYAKHWKDLAPKMAKAAGKFAQGAYQLQDTVRGIAEFQKFENSEDYKKLIDLKAENHLGLVYDAEKDQWILSNEGDADGANALQQRTINLSTHFARRKFVNWVKQNKQLLIADVQENIKAAGGTYDVDSAIPFMELGGLAILDQLGVSRTSRAGKQILNQFRTWGGLDKVKFYESNRVADTTKNIETLTETFRSTFADPEATQKEKATAFNNLVLAHKNGWFKTEYGKVLNPNNGGGMYSNTGDAGIAVMKHLIDTDTEGRITTKNAYEHLAGFGIPGTTYEWTTDQEVDVDPMPKETWSTKHRTRFDEEIAPYLVKAIKDRESKKNDKREADGIVFNMTFDKSVEEKISDGILSIPEAASLFKEVESADISDKQKKEAFNKINYFPTDYNNSGNLRNVLEHLRSGNIDEAMKIINASGATGLSARDKNFLRREVKVFQDLHKAQDGFGGNNGLEAILKEQLADFRELEKNRSRLNPTGKLDTSGEVAAQLAQGMIYDKFVASGVYTDLEGDEKRSTLSVSERLNNAKNEVAQLRKDAKEVKEDGKGGWVAVDGSQLDPTNPFHYYRTEKKGEYNGAVFYPFVGVDSDQQSAAAVEKQISLQEAKTDWMAKTSLIPLKPETIGTLLEHKVVSLKELLESPRVVSPDLLALVGQGAVDLKEGRYTVIPNLPNINYLVNSPYSINREGKRLSSSELTNAILKYQGYEVLLPLDSYDKVIQQNNGTNNFNERDVSALNIWTSCQAQGCFPKSWAAEGVLQGLDKNQSFFTQFPEAETNLGSALENGAMFKMDVDTSLLVDYGIIPDPNYWKWITGQQSTRDYHRGMEAIRLRNRSK
tara:strand:- start:1485 stop:4304 length:2820 start_codon:yes stop_codon:yes gene_type:complete